VVSRRTQPPNAPKGMVSSTLRKGMVSSTLRWGLVSRYHPERNAYSASGCALASAVGARQLARSRGSVPSKLM
jgi:hypothetical protein